MKYIIITILILALLGITYFAVISRSGSTPIKTDAGGKSASINDKSANSAYTVKIMENGLKIEDIKIGNGTEAKAGNTITVNYLGTLLNGAKFDSSYDRRQPFSFILGGGQVILGWDQGLVGMKVGGKRKLTIPPALAYGERGVPGAIPVNSILVFEVELLGVK